MTGWHWWRLNRWTNTREWNTLGLWTTLNYVGPLIPGFLKINTYCTIYIICSWLNPWIFVYMGLLEPVPQKYWGVLYSKLPGYFAVTEVTLQSSGHRTDFPGRGTGTLGHQNGKKMVQTSPPKVCMWNFPGSPVVENPAAKAGDTGSIPGWSLVWEYATCHWAAKPTCHNYWTCALESMFCH